MTGGRLLAAVLAAAAALLVSELASGGLGFGGERVRDPCQPRPGLSGSGLDPAAQRFALRGLDAAACHLGKSRERLVLDLAETGVDVVDTVERLRRRATGVLELIESALRGLR